MDWQTIKWTWDLEEGYVKTYYVGRGGGSDTFTEQPVESNCHWGEQEFPESVDKRHDTNHW